MARQVAAGITQPSQDGLSPAQQLEEINRHVVDLVNDQQRAWREVKAELCQAQFSVIEPVELTVDERNWLDAYFMEHVFPVLTPLAIDPAHPFPFIPNLGFVMAMRLTRRADNKTMTALLPVPSQLQRFIRLPDRGGKARYGPDGRREGGASDNAGQLGERLGRHRPRGQNRVTLRVNSGLFSQFRSDPIVLDRAPPPGGNAPASPA